MGLDSVELVMAVEEAFGIKIPDERACDTLTVGQLHDLVIELRGQEVPAGGVCLSAATFYLLRREICARLGLECKSIRPKTELEATIPRDQRRRLWYQLKCDLGLWLPPFFLPVWAYRLRIGFGLAAAVLLAAFILRPADFMVALMTFYPALLVVIATILAGLVVLMSPVMTPFRTQFHPALTTYRGLVCALVAGNRSVLSQRLNASPPSDVWGLLKSIIVYQLGVKPEEVKRDASFVGDLGIN